MVAVIWEPKTEEKEVARQQSMTGFVTRQSKTDDWRGAEQTAAWIITNMKGKDVQPVSPVESKAFQSLMAFLRYIFPPDKDICSYITWNC